MEPSDGRENHRASCHRHHRLLLFWWWFGIPSVMKKVHVTMGTEYLLGYIIINPPASSPLSDDVPIPQYKVLACPRTFDEAKTM